MGKLEFKIPDWLKNQDADSIHRRMLEALPADIDNTEGGFPWDFTRPTALEKAEMLQFYLVETLKLMHPMFAYGEWLDYHAQGVGISRKNPAFAYGELQITGMPGTVVPAGYLVGVPSVGENAAIGFEVLSECFIDDNGMARVSIKAEVPGNKGNVSAGAISIMISKPIEGIISVTNPERTTGGSEIESDDSLRQRIAEINEALEASFTGCNADYIRWAKEIEGVGTAYVMPQWNPEVPNSVKLALLDENGEPANVQIIDKVYQHIMSPDMPLQRKAPIGADLTVVAPKTVNIDYRFKVSLSEERDVDYIVGKFRKKIADYHTLAKEDGAIRYNMVGAALISIPEVLDYQELRINGGSENIRIEADEYPAIGTVSCGLDTDEVEYES